MCCLYVSSARSSPTPLAILKRSLAGELFAADGEHHLGILLSLSPEIHSLFDRFHLWFEATDEVCHQWTSAT